MTPSLVCARCGSVSGTIMIEWERVNGRAVPTRGGPAGKYLCSTCVARDLAKKRARTAAYRTRLKADPKRWEQYLAAGRERERARTRKRLGVPDIEIPPDAMCAICACTAKPGCGCVRSDYLGRPHARRLVPDHDRGTGRLRAFLCEICNRGLVSRVRDSLTKCDSPQAYSASVTGPRNMQRISDSPH